MYMGLCVNRATSLLGHAVPSASPQTRCRRYKAASKITSWSGVLLFGLLSDVYDDLRVGILAMSVFFFISVVLLFMIPVDSRRFREKCAAVVELD